MNYLLDTDTVSFWLRGEGRVVEALSGHRPSDLGVSAVTAGELELGAARRRSVRLGRLVAQFLSEMPVLPYDARAARAYGRVAAILLERGTPIGMASRSDSAQRAMIAAHAVSLGATLVTHNTRHFRRVRGLRVEDWY